jgi:hypothetical protein
MNKPIAVFSNLDMLEKREWRRHLPSPHGGDTIHACRF